MTPPHRHTLPLSLLVATLTSCHRSSPVVDAPPATVASAEATVDRCHDGDTCRLRTLDGFWFSVRLAGLDAPEVAGRGAPAQPMADAAQRRLSELVQGQRVTVRQVDLDRYNRPVVELRRDGRLVNLLLLEAGLAELYQEPPAALDRRLYAAAAARAQAQRLGIWALADYVSPGAFRRARRR